ncbi:MAG: hypothetical protein U0930_05575 [Pirellulales bacterium]
MSKSEARSLSTEEVVRRAMAEFGFLQCGNVRGVRFAAEALARRSDLTHEGKDLAMIPLMEAVEMIGNDRRSD